jgi:hypothetical protein
LVLVTGALLALAAARCPRIAIPCALIGLFLLATLLLLPSGWSPFDSDMRLSPTWPEIGIEALLVLACWFARRHAPPTPILAVAAVATFGSAAAALAGLAAPAPAVPATAPRPSAAGPNIYQFVFDGFGARAFDPARAGGAANLAGFTFYPDNRANYFATDASLPSIFTGRFFTGGSFRAFQDEARRGGVRAALRRAGYRISLYVPDRNRFWWFDRADHGVTNQDLLREANDPAGGISLLQAALIEAAPIGLRRPVALATREIWRWSKYNFYKQNVGLFARFAADEARRPARGQYVYFHIMLPHPDYTHAADCRRTGDSSYSRQAACAERLMAATIALLRRLGRLDASLVIFQGDHGFQASESDLAQPRAPMPAAVRRRLADLGDSYGPDELMQRAHALLLVHPPSAPRRPLAVSGARTQLIDLAPTIANAAGLPRWQGPGWSLLGGSPPRRAWHFFAGVTRKTGLFRRRMGRDADRGRLAHLSIDREGRWHIHPDVVAHGSGEVPGR